MNREIDYQQALMNEVVVSRGIRAFLFDLDDTLVSTNDVFRLRMEQFAANAAFISGRESEVVSQTLRDALDALRHTMGLDHDLMEVGAHIALRRVEIDPESIQAQHAIAQLLEIYSGKDYRQFHGVENTLAMLHGTRADTHVVTHASQESTQGKLRAAGLSGRFSQVFCVDPKGKKDEFAWKSVIDTLQLQPSQVFVVGDNWTSDIAPAVAIGVPKKHIIRIRTDHKHSNGSVISGVQEVDSVRDLPEYLLSLL